MCDPVSAGIAMAVGAGASLYGSMSSANASRASANAISAQNQATLKAQNEGYTSRLNASLAAIPAQENASREILTSRDSAASQMRAAQQKALDNYDATLKAENAQAESLRKTGDAAAQTLLANTDAQSLQGAQGDWKTEAANLLAPSQAPGPAPTDPNGTDAVQGDAVQGAASARRTAEAATNVRNYGSKIAQVGSYAAPINRVNLGISENKAQIMPAQQADELLRSGSAARLLPSHVAYTSATGLGGALDTLLQSKGQNALDAAKLSYGNATELANLKQADEETLAKNKGAQAIANADYAKTQAGVISGLGNLATYGAGYYGGDALKSSLSGLFK